MTQTILDEIKAYKLDEIANAKAARPYETVAAEAQSAPPCLLYTSPSPRD